DMRISRLSGRHPPALRSDGGTCAKRLRRRRAELREVFGRGFGKKFFVIPETICRDVRGDSRIPRQFVGRKRILRTFSLTGEVKVRSPCAPTRTRIKSVISRASWSVHIGHKAQTAWVREATSCSSTPHNGAYRARRERSCLSRLAAVLSP